MIRKTLLVAGDETGHVVHGTAAATVDLDDRALRRAPFADWVAADGVEKSDLAVDHRALPYLVLHLQDHCRWRLLLVTVLAHVASKRSGPY